LHHLSGNGDLNLNTSLDVDDDLLDDLSGGVKVDQALVDPVVAILSAKSSSHLNNAKPIRAVQSPPGKKSPRQSTRSTIFLSPQVYNSPHLVGVPGLGALTARGLAGGDLQVLGGHANGALSTLRASPLTLHTPRRMTRPKTPSPSLLLLRATVPSARGTGRRRRTVVWWERSPQQTVLKPT
jgi:hypothetical protein